MIFAKLNENAQLEYAPNPILEEGNWYSNPSDALYSRLGFKPIRYTSHDIPPAGCYYSEGWRETETEIVQDWNVIEFGQDDELDSGAILAVLLGGAAL